MALEMNDIMALKSLENGLSPYESFKVSNMQSKRPYEGLSEEERRTFVTAFGRDHSQDAVMAKLNEIERKVEKNKYSFITDVGANVLGNAVWDIPVWIIKRLLIK